MRLIIRESALRQKEDIRIELDIKELDIIGMAWLGMYHYLGYANYLLPSRDGTVWCLW